jgi:hypothetical protein
MEALLSLIKRINPQKMNVSKSENMLIHLQFTHFITSNKSNFKFLVAPNKKGKLQSLESVLLWVSL